MASKSSVMCVVLLVVSLVDMGSAHVEKLSSCCTKVSPQEITEPILGYLVQRKSLPCVTAVIFQTEKGMFCSQLRVPWVRRKITELEAARRDAFAFATDATTVPSPTPSLLSLLTSPSSHTASSPTPSSSSPPSSSPSHSSPTSSSSSSSSSQ